ncbi:MAG: Hpt domain-containing protein [Firmicutes bacterium]|nr:Hpt domain-containing protein [Bacillota bacterium]
MLTIDALKGIGVEPEDGLKRCLNNEDFYLNLVKMVPADQGFQKLQDSLEAGDLDGAFEAAHALKGVLSNLSLTPLCKPVEEITELLRARTDMDYSELLQEILEKRTALEGLCE